MKDYAPYIRELRQKLAEAGVEGSPPPWETTIARLERLACEARADAARLREALENIDGAWKGELDDEMSMEQVQAFIAETLRAALASTPSAEPTPRDMRVAEAVRDACAAGIEVAQRKDERFGCDDSYWNGMSASIDCVRDLDLAAVVAKAVKP